jgi:hypothetical protein
MQLEHRNDDLSPREFFGLFRALVKGFWGVYSDKLDWLLGGLSLAGSNEFFAMWLVLGYEKKGGLRFKGIGRIGSKDGA